MDQLLLENSAPVFSSVLMKALTTSVSAGRPVDVLQMPDGAILVSDDQLGALYRISYTTPTVATQSLTG